MNTLNKLRDYNTRLTLDDRDDIAEQFEELQKEIEGLKEALVYVAHAGHSTPQYMLPPGIILGGNDTVEVKLNAGKIVIATWRTDHD